MSHFYAAIPTSARRTVATARGHKSTGIETYAASWGGKISVWLHHDEFTGKDHFQVRMDSHLNGAGDAKLLATGIVGEAGSVTFG